VLYYIFLLLLEVTVATDPVWYDISIFLKESMNKNALRVFVYNGRHGIKEKLGITQNNREFVSNNQNFENIIESSGKYTL